MMMILRRTTRVSRLSLSRMLPGRPFLSFPFNAPLRGNSFSQLTFSMDREL
jgi:hypothetical protein